MKPFLLLVCLCCFLLRPQNPVQAASALQHQAATVSIHPGFKEISTNVTCLDSWYENEPVLLLQCADLENNDRNEILRKTRTGNDRFSIGLSTIRSAIKIARPRVVHPSSGSSSIYIIHRVIRV